MDKEICICAAVIAQDGAIIRGHRHGNCIHAILDMGKIPGGVDAQGFITSRNRFVGRGEGRQLQNAAGIKSIWTKEDIEDILVSEDLY